MRTRNSYFPNNSSVTIMRRRNKRRTPNVVESELRTIVEVAPMADNRTMKELLQAPTEEYGEATVIPEINADHFKIKTNLIQLVQVNPYYGFERENPHTHINNFKMITSTLKFRDVLNDVIKLMMFSYSLKGSAFEETFGEAWERFKEMLGACPHHGFTKLAQIDAFYNALNDNDQDSLNDAVGGNLLSKTTIEALQIIENKSKVHYSRNKPNVSRMNTTFRENASKSDDRIDKLADQNLTLVDIFAKKLSLPLRLKRLRNLVFADALLLMPKFASTIKSLLTNKDKLFELAKIQLNGNCSAMLLKKLLEKLEDPGKFLIPCDFSGMDVCHALADLGASINLMPLSIWKNLSLPKLTPTWMTLKLADRSITHPKGVVEDIFVKVGKFHFSTDFVVVDFEADPRVPLILGRSFLRTGHALTDVYGEEITLQVNDKFVTFNLNQTTRYSSTYDDLSVNRIDIIDVAREEYAQEILGFSNISSGGNPTSTSEPIISDSSLSLTPFVGSDFILEEIEAYLKDESISPEIEHADFKAKSLIEEPPELELKDLPFHLKYAYLQGEDKLPVNIAKDLKDNEKEALLKVLKSHKRVIAWKITDIKGIDPRFCTHKILMEEDYKPAVQSQRWVNPKIHEVIKKEVIKLLDAGMIYPIFDSPKLNDANRKDHFPLPFMDQMLKRHARNEFYCFLDRFSRYFQILINPPDQEKTTFTYPYGTFAYHRMPFGLCNAHGPFQRCMMAIFHNMIEKTMELFMDDFSVFGDSFSSCLSHLDTMLQWCKDTNLVLNWEKCHFMVKEGIVLGHKISKNRLEVDRAKVDVIAKLPHPTRVKGVRSFLGHAGFYRRFIQDFSKISRPMTHLLEKETPFVFSKDCIDAFETLKKKLTEAPILVVPDWNLPFELMCDASDFAIGAVLG
nr:reverse transcriptase domain-containing protein [Tanacetum cinerariifolium]